MVFPAGQAADFRHIALHDVRKRLPVTVGDFALLKMDVRILHRAAQHGMVGVEGAAAERVDGLPVQQPGQFFILQHFDLLHLVGRPEAVEEVEERNAPLDRRQVGDRRQVHDLLHAAFGQHGEAGLARRHDIGMVAKNADGIGADHPGAYVEHAWQQLAGDLVHVGDHQQQPLRSGVGRRQGPCLQRAVHGAGRAAFRLHFHHVHRLAENVLAAFGCPFIGAFRHVGRRCDGKDGGDIGEGVRNMRCRRIPIHGLHFSSCVCHCGASMKPLHRLVFVVYLHISLCLPGTCSSLQPTEGTPAL